MGNILDFKIKKKQKKYIKKDNVIYLFKENESFKNKDKKDIKKESNVIYLSRSKNRNDNDMENS